MGVMRDLNDLKYNQWVAREMRRLHGCELTPEQVKATRLSALRKIRSQLSDLNPPEDDDALLKWFAALTSGIHP